MPVPRNPLLSSFLKSSRSPRPLKVYGYRGSSRNQYHDTIEDNAMNTASPLEPVSNPKVEHNTRAFLKGLNSAEGPPLEQF
jgi:hypothetical protein